mgnify:CR=1 FL=1
MANGELTYDDFLQRLDIQDILMDAGYHLNKRDGLRYPSYIRTDNNGTRIRGDKFIVTPNGKCCFQPPQQKLYNIISFIKAFPISNYYGPDLAKVFKVPCPQIPILASGGANFDNLHTWFENGVDSVGLGGLLTKGSSADIAENARKLRAIVEESRKAA